MGFFSESFGSGGKNKAEPKVADFVKGLDGVRKTWFDSCVKILQQNPVDISRHHFANRLIDAFSVLWDEEDKEGIERQFSDMFALDNIEILDVKNTDLRGEAEVSMKAYQYYVLSDFIMENAYVPPSNWALVSVELKDLLGKNLSTPQLQRFYIIMKPYQGLWEFPSWAVQQLSSDIAEHITGNKAPQLESVLIASVVPNFVVFTQLAAAKCEKDEKTINQLQSKLKRLATAAQPIESEREEKAPTMAKNPNDAKAHYNLGSTYFKKGYYEKAIEAYKDAIRIEPDYAKAWDALGVANYKIKRYQEAVTAYKQVIRIKPDLAAARYNLGVAYLGFGNKGSALEQYKILMSFNPDLAEKLFDAIHK